MIILTKSNFFNRKLYNNKFICLLSARQWKLNSITENKALVIEHQFTFSMYVDISVLITSKSYLYMNMLESKSDHSIS